MLTNLLHLNRRLAIAALAATLIAHAPALAQAGASGTTRLPPELTPSPEPAAKPSPSEQEMVLWQNAMAALGVGECSEAARASLDSLVTALPGNPDARVLRALVGLCSPDQRRLAEACSDIDLVLASLDSTKSTALGQSFTHCLTLKAHLLVARGQDSQALQLIMRAIHVDPEESEGIFNSGDVHPDSATSPCEWRMRDLNGLVRRNPSDYRAYLARGLYYRFFGFFDAGSKTYAQRDFDRACQLAPRSALSHYLRGAQLVRGNASFSMSGLTSKDRLRYQLAVGEFRAATALDRNFAPAYSGLATTLNDLGLKAEALASYNAFLRIKPTDREGLKARGLLRRDRGDHWGAAEDLEAATQDQSADPTFLGFTFQLLAEVKARLEQYDEACEAMTESIRIFLRSQSASLGERRMRALFPELGSAPSEEVFRTVYEAVRPAMTFELFSKFQSEETMAKMESTVLPSAYVQRGDYYLRAGSVAEALADYRRARNSYPSSVRYTDRWRLAYHSSSRDFYVDSQLESVPSGSAPQLWVRVDDPRVPEPRPYSLDRLTVDCESQHFTLAASSRYSSDGTLLSSAVGDPSPSPITPDSVGEWFFRALCGRGLR